jgi:hypothetical protein
MITLVFKVIFLEYQKSMFTLNFFFTRNIFVFFLIHT